MRLIPINTPLVVSTAFLIVAGITVLSQLPNVAGAIFAPRPGEDPTRARLAEYLERHDEDLGIYRARFDGRSLFFRPQAPRRKTAAPPPPPPDDDTPAPLKPLIPPTYKGPTPRYVVGDDVWFHDGVKVRVGETGANGVTIISSDPPWKLRLGHGGGEYDYQLFERTYPGLDATPRSPGPTPGLKTVEPETSEPLDEAAAGQREGKHREAPP